MRKSSQIICTALVGLPAFSQTSAFQIASPSSFGRNTADYNHYSSIDISTRQTSSLFYAESATLEPGDLTFVERMRKIALNEQLRERRQMTPTTIDAPSIRRSKRKPDHIKDVMSLTEFQQTVVGTVQEPQRKVSAVRWHAPWCRTCKAVEPIYYGMHRHFDTKHVQFVDVESTPENGNLHVGFGVPKVPYGHIYHPEYGLVEQLKLTPKAANDFQAILKSYVAMQCELPKDIDPDSGVFGPPYERLS